MKNIFKILHRFSDGDFMIEFGESRGVHINVVLAGKFMNCADADTGI